jgi:hypothetical protein
MRKWEYVVAPLRAEDVAPDRLNELGRQGWEAVGVTLDKGDLLAWPIVLLKRPIEESTSEARSLRTSDPS